MPAPEGCPRCGNGAVLFGSSRLRHLLRRLSASHRRYCPSCGCRWLSTTRDYSMPVSVAACSLGAALLVLVILAAGRREERRLDARTAGQGVLSGMPGMAAKAGKGVVEPGDAGPTDMEAGGLEGGPVFERSALVEAPPAQEAEGGPRYRAAASVGPEWSVLGLLGDLRAMLKLAGGSERAVSRDVDTLSKKDLWDKYGHYFSSKEEAKTAYGEYKQRRARGEKPPSEPPPQ